MCDDAIVCWEVYGIYKHRLKAIIRTSTTSAVTFRSLTCLQERVTLSFQHPSEAYFLLE
jgi:hypothetical protein